MKNLLTITALIEFITGLILVTLLSLLAFLLPGRALDNSVALTVAGVDLVALEITRWLTQRSSKQRGERITRFPDYL